MIHDFRDDNNWFATYPNNKISLITSYQWDYLSNTIPLICSIGSSIIQIIQHFEIYSESEICTQKYNEEQFKNYNNEIQVDNKNKLNHFNTIGCLNDFCGKKLIKKKGFVQEISAQIVMKLGKKY